MPVDLDFARLRASDAQTVREVGEAFGSDGLGFLVVRNVPGFVEARRRLLPLIRRFAQLPQDVRDQYVSEATRYQFGWSHGKEKLENGNLDVAKGSYYANPFDAPGDRPPAGDAAAVRDTFLSSDNNLWPAEIAEFEAAFKEMSAIMRSAATALASCADAFVRSSGAAEADKLSAVLTHPSCAKGRLLYYFPQTKPADKDGDTKWCGWHSDHGSLTCLTKAMYFDQDGQEVTDKVGDDLAIESRDGAIHNVRIPSDAIAFQIGQAAQIQSGSVLRATPHCVTYPPHINVSRCTFALFFQPDSATKLAVPANVVADGLPVQYQEGMTFGDFTAAIINSAYTNPEARSRL